MLHSLRLVSIRYSPFDNKKWIDVRVKIGDGVDWRGYSPMALVTNAWLNCFELGEWEEFAELSDVINYINFKKPSCISMSCPRHRETSEWNNAPIIRILWDGRREKYVLKNRYSWVRKRKMLTH